MDSTVTGGSICGRRKILLFGCVRVTAGVNSIEAPKYLGSAFRRMGKIGPRFLLGNFLMFVKRLATLDQKTQLYHSRPGVPNLLSLRCCPTMALEEDWTTSNSPGQKGRTDRRTCEVWRRHNRSEKRQHRREQGKTKQRRYFTLLIFFAFFKFMKRAISFTMLTL